MGRYKVIAHLSDVVVVVVLKMLVLLVLLVLLISTEDSRVLVGVVSTSRISTIYGSATTLDAMLSGVLARLYLRLVS